MYIGVGLVQDPIKTGQVTTNISYCTDYITRDNVQFDTMASDDDDDGATVDEAGVQTG